MGRTGFVARGFMALGPLTVSMGYGPMTDVPFPPPPGEQTVDTGLPAPVGEHLLPHPPAGGVGQLPDDVALPVQPFSQMALPALSGSASAGPDTPDLQLGVDTAQATAPVVLDAVPDSERKPVRRRASAKTTKAPSGSAKAPAAKVAKKASSAVAKTTKATKGRAKKKSDPPPPPAPKPTKKAVPKKPSGRAKKAATVKKRMASTRTRKKKL